jgi:hypothetical protein
MKSYEGVDAEIYVFLTSTLVGSEWSASRFGRFTAGERTPGAHWVERRLGGSQSRSGRCGEEKTLDLTSLREPKILRGFLMIAQV